MLLKKLSWQEAAASAKAEDNKRRRTVDGMKRKERDSTADGSSKDSSKVPFCRKSQWILRFENCQPGLFLQYIQIDGQFFFSVGER